jgi:hypothetical protein
MKFKPKKFSLKIYVFRIFSLNLPHGSLEAVLGLTKMSRKSETGDGLDKS